MDNILPRFPLYIPSKGRSEYMMTSKYLTHMGIKHNIIVEPSQVDEYRKSVKSKGLKAEILELDMAYKKKYDLCDSHGLNKSTGSGPARNFIWDHSSSFNHPWHWIMDDNIRYFGRLNKNKKIKVINPSLFIAMEDFCLRYENISMAGPQYVAFAPARTKMPPFVINTRIYSCNLIRNNVPFRWRGRYNEDTILSLDMLKAKWCTVLFNAFLQMKMPTQALPGGNTDELYHGGNKLDKTKYSHTGTIDKSRMLVDVHPDVSRLVYRFGRIHHHVDYSKFKKNKIIRKDDLIIDKGINNYGMVLKGKQEALFDARQKAEAVAAS
jgi:hypothetical protein